MLSFAIRAAAPLLPPPPPAAIVDADIVWGWGKGRVTRQRLRVAVVSYNVGVTIAMPKRHCARCVILLLKEFRALCSRAEEVIWRFSVANKF